MYFVLRTPEKSWPWIGDVPSGPFNSVREAMTALWDEFFTDNPSNLCYFLTTTDNDEPIYVTMSNEITFVDNNGNRID